MTENGEPAAVLISVDEFGELQQAQDEADIALCQTIKARGETGLPHDEFMASVVAALGDDPRPPHSNPLGTTSFRRVRLDHYRILHEVGDTDVRVMHVGRVV